MVQFYDTNNITLFPFHSTDPLAFPDGKPISTMSQPDTVIGNSVYVGLGSTILSGFRVGDGAVITPGTVVLRDVDDFEIVTGASTTHVAYRLPPDLRKSVKELAWWDWSDTKINANVSLLESNDVLGLLLLV
jgi:acetyltransferase-like isoleucine patch superfamily enzyme